MADRSPQERSGPAAGGQRPAPDVLSAFTSSTAEERERAKTALRRVNANAPAALAARARRARLVGERKPVTAVFADIVGSTSLAELVDPEDWTLVINGAFDAMSRCIYEYEGTIAQIQGDAIISFFGAPVAHEDDPERAVRAALAMTRAVEAYAGEVRREHGFELRVRVGVSTGIVLVGEVGSDLRFDYTAIGDTMNVASRLQGQAPPGGVLISDRTERFVGPLFDLEDVGELDLKGKSDTVQAFRVVSERGQPGPTRGLQGLDSPMVGRAAELEALTRTAATVRAGVGRVALIVGEPGLGKSRLIRELKASLQLEDDTSDSAPIAWMAAHGSSHSQHSPLHLVRGLVLDVLGVSAADSGDDVAAALASVLARLDHGERETAGYLAYLLGLPMGGEEAALIGRLSGDLLEERVVAAVMRLVRSSAAQGPVSVVVDDLHWADGSSVEVLRGLLTLVDEAPLLILLGTREEPSAPGWGVVRAARDLFGRALVEIRLEPLDHVGAERLVSNLLEIESLPRDTRELILAKAEGNPLFVEEVIRMLIEREAITREGERWVATGAVADVTIPDTVHGLVLSRIDRLPDDARRVLRVASCIERRFAVPLLEEIMAEAGDETPVRSSLGRLEGAGLIALEATLPELEYRFSHALIQDAAYETVLRQERREWHERIAATLLRRHPDREVAMAGRLAFHYEEAGDASRATHYLVMAARDVMMRNSLVEAGMLLMRAMALLDRLPDPDSDTSARLRLEVIIGRVSTGFLFMRMPETQELLDEGRSLARRVGDPTLLSNVLFLDVLIRQAAGERPETSPELTAAIEALDRLGHAPGDEHQRAMILYQTGVVLWATGQFEASMRSLAEAAAMMERMGDAVGASMAMGYYAGNLATMGDFEAADERMRESRRLADEADDLARLDYQLVESVIAAARGDYPTSVRFASDCLRAASDMGAFGCATVAGIILGASQMAAGDAAQAQTTLQKSLEYAAQGYMAPQRTRANLLLASAAGMGGDLTTARDGFRVALAELAATGNPYATAEAELLRGLVMAMHPEGDPQAALQDLETAAELFESAGARPSLARARRAQGMALARLGQAGTADAALRGAAELATSMGLRDGPWPASLDELEATRSAPSPLERID